MSRHRLRFKKEGKAVYISHLDLMRLFQRAFLRAGLTVRHTEGFNPHAYISVALPLSVGFESDCELLDFELISGCGLSEVPEKLNAVMPEGIAVLSAYEADRKLKDIAWLRAKGVLEYDRGADDSLIGELLRFYKSKEIVVLKKSKKGFREIDIIPCIAELQIIKSGDTLIELNSVLAAQNPSLNPELLIEALRQKAPKLTPDFASFKRLEVFDKDMEVFD